ncbi:MAG: hypothetical protein ACO35E_12185 [Ilumatobacteraceae bacterium]
MPSITMKNAAGSSAGSVDLDDAVFGIQPHVPVMPQVVPAQLAAPRAGTGRGGERPPVEPRSR